MNLRDFKYLVEIAKHGSITKAANALFVSQPALSKFLSKLEEDIGNPSFLLNTNRSVQ
ncbi:helix-turn-helix domain-containing protein [Fusibacter ferrireducens]|uniref:LysR family transcriptional regulator n=1 Tax=Fusibacter ferrireducens TaxID=2785058 RepID=A0ABR9ZUI1_9FIRM|nr:LysR family transcriptional regulator [Fusibacter ferrireducens]MBF4694100.1 LysR family transcriptional regulator [Fusibacter ferrireducens]